MKQPNKQPIVYHRGSRKTRIANITTSDLAEIGAKIQEAQAILNSISLEKIAKRGGTTRQNLQQIINRRKSQKGGK